MEVRGFLLLLLLLLPLLGSIYKDDSSKWSGFPYKKNLLKSLIKKIYKNLFLGFKNCLANRALKEVSDGNSTMFCGRLLLSFIVLGKNENLW